MNRNLLLMLVVSGLMFALASCGGHDPVMPTDSPDNPVTMAGNYDDQSIGNRTILGLYHIVLDPATESAEITPMRTADVNLNITRLLETPFNPTEHIGIDFILDECDVQNGLFVLDMSINHPFPGLNQFRVFDMRGIFMSDATSHLPGDPNLLYADETCTHLNNPDGYTRFWNSTEFPLTNIFGFCQSNLAPPNHPSAILNPYMYFCDDLGAIDPLENVTTENRGTFTADFSPVTRRYSIQFKMQGDKPVFDYNLAIDASWENIGDSAPSYDVDAFSLSANCQEPWRLEIDTSESTLYYTDAMEKGGSLNLDLTVHDWQGLKPGSSVATQVSGINLHSDMIPDGKIEILSNGAALISDENGVALWKFSIDADDLILTNNEDQDLWIEALSSDPNNYAPQIPGGDSIPHADGILAAYNLGSVSISGTPLQEPPEVLIIDPDWGYQDENPLSIQITGANFIADGLSVEFDNGSFSIPVSNMMLVSDSELTCDLDLTSAEPGLYDVTVRVNNQGGPGTLEGTLENGFTVLPLFDYYGWPMIGRNGFHNNLAIAAGPQTSSSQVYSEDADPVTSTRTIMIGVDPDDPGDQLLYISYYHNLAHSFSAYHVSDGSVKWTVPAPSPFTFLRLIAVAPPGVPCPNGESGTVYVAAYPPSHVAPEKFYALSAHDGSILWEYQVPGVGSWMQLDRYGYVDDDGNLIYCHTSEGNYIVSIGTDGLEVWSIYGQYYPAVKETTPVVSPDGNTMYIMDSGVVRIYAYDLLTNPPAQKWTVNFSTLATSNQESSPMVAADGAIYINSRTSRLIKIIDNGTSGSIDWSTPEYGTGGNVRNLLSEGPEGSIYMIVPDDEWGSPPGTVMRFDPTDGSLLDQGTPLTGVDHYNGMAVGTDGLIYLGATGYIYCLNADCSVQWSISVPGSEFGDAVLDDFGSVFLHDRINGKIYRFQD